MSHSLHRSSRFLNVFTVSAMTTDSGRLFQCATTRRLLYQMLNYVGCLIIAVMICFIVIRIAIPGSRTVFNPEIPGL